MKQAFKRRGLWAGLLFFALVAGVAAVLTAPPPMPSFAAVRDGWQSSDAVLLDRHGAVLDRRRIDYDLRRRDWLALSKMSPALTAALIKAEDKRFRSHGGVDVRALGSALWGRLHGRPLRGASTITMQLAGFLAPDLRRGQNGRSVMQKLRQMRAAWRLEGDWSKPQILEAYINLLNYRGEVQGVDAAARLLFGKTATGLTAAESVALAALLPAPNASPQRITARACRIGQPLSCKDIGAAVAVMLTRSAPGMAEDALAPQLAAALLSKPGQSVQTTLDAGLQAFVRMTLAEKLGSLNARGVRDGAAIVVDNQTGEILAYVGSAGPNSRAPAVDGASAPRQAGSTLKPFLYALAIGKKYLTAASILDDSPVSLDTASGLYIPADYDRSYRGPVSLRTALAGSLNVPAVRTLLLTGVEPFRDLLVDLGYAHVVEDGSYYGFSLALGSAEVTLLEQAAAYRTLARGGRYAPLRLRMADEEGADRAVLDPLASYIVADILADPAARAGSFGMENNLNLPFWAAVKTGTSKAMRDNWCIGFSSRYTVGVWVGNFEGDSMEGVSGIFGAAPAWRSIMLRLHDHLPSHRPALPDGIQSRSVAYQPAIEPPRRDLFIAGTGQAVFRLTPGGAAVPKIAHPVNGSILALDPDIPPDRQLLLVRTAGTRAPMRLMLDGRDFGPADREHLWRPVRGYHRLELMAEDRLLDRVLFQVR